MPNIMARDHRGSLLQTITVLIADDSASDRHGLRGILRAYDDIKVVGEADSGDTAVSLATEMRPDVIVMDAQMPGVDGLEATRRIKDRAPDSKVLLLTVHSALMDEALDAGVDLYMLKDAGRERLVQGIRELASGGNES